MSCASSYNSVFAGILLQRANTAGKWQVWRGYKISPGSRKVYVLLAVATNELHLKSYFRCFPCVCFLCVRHYLESYHVMNSCGFCSLPLLWHHCLGYSRAEALCKEYRQTKGPGTTAKPSEQLFFLKLGGVIKNTLEKCQRENGFMWVSQGRYTHLYLKS